MVKLRKAVSYRRIERPYTRKSKYKNKMYVRSIPVSKVVRYTMGNPSRTYEHALHLLSKADLQIRHNAIESARVVCSRVLEQNLPKGGYLFQIRIYPHHILRENPLAAGAGADRMSTGMQRSFGKCIGVAAQVHKGKEIFTVKVDKQYLETARRALKAAGHKFACRTQIVME